MSSRAERVGVRIGFGFLALLGGGLVVRLAQLQLVPERAVALRRVQRQGQRESELPAPRGTILDRNGELLAYDRPVFEVRAEARFKTPDREHGPSEEYTRRLSSELAWALCGDPENRSDHARRHELRAKLRERIRAAKPRRHLDRRVRQKRGEAPQWQRSIDFLVADPVDSATSVRRLRDLAKRHWYLQLHFRPNHERVYPSREYTHGIVGHVGEVELPNGETRTVHTGVERLSVLEPGKAGAKPFAVDARARRFYVADGRAPTPPNVVQLTLDLPLQRQAVRLLDQAVAAVEARYRSPPRWGSLCLIEIATGDVLAAASYRRGVHPAAGAFAPLQSLCAPGSVVKPLVFALAVERGVLDWDRDRIDCRPNRPRNGWRVPEVRRVIRDEHRCDVIDAHHVLVMSSNIGAAKVGRRLGREGIVQFLDLFGFATKTACELPGERAGSIQPSRAKLLRLPERSFVGYTAPSYSIGYDYNVTPMQVARAYLTLLSGQRRELRLFRRYRVGDRVLDVPDPARGPKVLSDTTLARVRAAMVDVVGEHEHATGRPVLARLRELGHGPGVIAGKTGTSEVNQRVEGRRVMVRTALFAGFTPVDSPRYLALCVLQKERASSFWGGRYAGPAAAELLLQAAERASAPRRPARTLVGQRVASPAARVEGSRASPGREGSGI